MDLGTRPTANEVKAMLGLEPHPTCGFVAETYRSPLRIPAGALPEAYEGDRPYGSALYFLVAPDAQIVMHRIRSDQLYHHYMGDPLEVLMLYPDGTGAVTTVGSDLTAGSVRSCSSLVTPSTPHACGRAPTTHCWPAPSGPGWSPLTWSTATSRRWSGPIPTWPNTYAPSRAEHNDPTWHVREVGRCRWGTMLLLSAPGTTG